MSFTILQIRKPSCVLTFVCQALVFVPVLGPRNPPRCAEHLGSGSQPAMFVGMTWRAFQTEAVASHDKLLIQ